MATYSLAGGIAELYDSTRFSDVIVRCGDSLWHAHKFVLCTQSEFFSKACEGEFKVSQDETVRLHIREQWLSLKLGSANGMHRSERRRARGCRRHVLYLYKATYDDKAHQEGSCASIFNVKVYAIAEKYLVEELQQAAAQNFYVSARSEWNTPGFAEAIALMSAIVPCPDSMIYDEAVDAVLEHATALLSPTSATDRFMEVMTQAPSFAADIAQRLALRAENLERRVTYTCPHRECKEVFVSSVRPKQMLYRVCNACGNTKDMTYEAWQQHRAQMPSVRGYTPSKKRPNSAVL